MKRCGETHHLASATGLQYFVYSGEVTFCLLNNTISIGNLNHRMIIDFDFIGKMEGSATLEVFSIYVQTLEPYLVY